MFSSLSDLLNAGSNNGQAAQVVGANNGSGVGVLGGISLVTVVIMYAVARYFGLIKRLI